ncbi:MAG TPA: YebC/PmpR family DNA-binding transcriptional regulator [Candidatus Polarisedimenticolaceae bacterium]|nr:YebC/PmpR family DNA-binding transcriptional regulator [Candidatus Polarisedimenticolaceae bacterium]
MSGHSKWSTIKHKKAAADAKRGKAFTRLIKELTVAAKTGGGDPDGNPRLRSAIADAKANNMPAENIKRAIQKGTGELPGVTYEDVVYEGYGPGGVAVYVEVLTDNKMRTTPEIRHAFTKHGGELGQPNSVSWMFEKRGTFSIPLTSATEERLMDVILEAGADDLQTEDDAFQVTCGPGAFPAVRDALEKAGVTPTEAKLAMLPTNVVELDAKKAAQCLRLLEALEEHDDVQSVSANLSFDEASVAEEA